MITEVVWCCQSCVRNAVHTSTVLLNVSGVELDLKYV